LQLQPSTSLKEVAGLTAAAGQAEFHPRASADNLALFAGLMKKSYHEETKPSSKTALYDILLQATPNGALSYSP